MTSGMVKSLTYLTLALAENCIHFLDQGCYSQGKAALVMKVLPQSSGWPRFHVMYFMKQPAEFSVL